MKRPDIAPGFEPQKIEVKKFPTADTRSCDPSKVTKERLLESSRQHIADVDRALRWMENQLSIRSYCFCLQSGGLSYHHDHDKIEDIDGFHRDFKGGNFVERAWYQNHIRVNRHHLAAEGGVPDDVNLFDVLEMIADGSVAGMARSGSVYPIELPDELLQTAVKNTLDMIVASIEVLDKETT